MRTREEQAESLRDSLCDDYKSAVVHEAGYELAMCHILEAERRAEARVRKEIGQDSERLDWLGEYDVDVVYVFREPNHGFRVIMRNTQDTDIRVAIDAAREVG